MISRDNIWLTSLNSHSVKINSEYKKSVDENVARRVKTSVIGFVDIPNTFKNNINAKNQQNLIFRGISMGITYQITDYLPQNDRVCHFTKNFQHYDHVISRDISHEMKLLVTSFSKHPKFLIYDQNLCHTSHLKPTDFLYTYSYVFWDLKKKHAYI